MLGVRLSDAGMIRYKSRCRVEAELVPSEKVLCPICFISGTRSLHSFQNSGASRKQKALESNVSTLQCILSFLCIYS